MLVPWLLLFGYLKLVPQWDSVATVAATTPILINLGQLYKDAFPEGNYVLLRIEEAIIGIALGAILTILIFPIFAVDRLKANIQSQCQCQIVHYLFEIFFRYVENMSSCCRIDSFCL
jgi:uncharacterized membrane protein YccC